MSSAEVPCAQPVNGLQEASDPHTIEVVASLTSTYLEVKCNLFEPPLFEWLSNPDE